MALISFKNLDQSTWQDLEYLFGEKGACGGCWCMYWRLTNKEYEAGKGTVNKDRFNELVNRSWPLGILGYEGNKPIGWCSISPRKELPRLERSRLLKPIDDEPVWSITCLFIQKAYRRKGLSKHLIKAAVEYARSQGARIVEAYPIVPKKDKMPDVFAWVGFFDAFKSAGFTTELNPSETRAIMRYYCK